MLNYSNWKKLNESLHNLGMKQMPTMMIKNMASYLQDEEDEDTKPKAEDEMEVEEEDDVEEEGDDEEDEDEEEEADEEDEVEEVDMEDAEEAEGDDEDDSEDENEDDSESMSSEKPSEDKEDMSNMKHCWSKCGSYMSAENTMPSHIPSLEEWQKSVSSMLDSSCMTKRNFDGVVINEALGFGLDNPLKKFADKLEEADLGTGKLKILAHEIMGMLHDALLDKMSTDSARSRLMNEVKKAFKEAAEEQKAQEPAKDSIPVAPPFAK